jgi:hypothetical protein
MPLLLLSPSTSNELDSIALFLSPSCLTVSASLLVLCVSDVLLLLLIATSSDMAAELSSALTPSTLDTVMLSLGTASHRSKDVYYHHPFLTKASYTF